VSYINVNDSTYASAGYLAVLFYNNAPDGLVHSALFDNFGVINNLSGSWQSITKSLAAAGTYGTSLISWQQVVNPTGSASLVVQTSVDGGVTYQVCTSGGQIPNLSVGQSLASVNLIIQVLFTSASANQTPILSGLTAWVIGQFSSSGTWQNTPLGNDTLTRANVVGSLGTATDGQPYTKVGTGTVALTSNEGIISATTGDVEMVLGSHVAADEDGSIRFSLSTTSMQFGIELRRVDVNNFYRLSTTTTLLTMAQKASGVMATLATAGVALSINAYYRMRFRIVGNGPVSLLGRIWLDGLVEPSTWNVLYTH